MSKTKTMTQLQVRIDPKIKEKARDILENLGLDISTAVKILFHQIVNTKTFPITFRDENGFSLEKMKILDQAIIDAQNSKSFTSAKDLIKDILG